MDRYGVPPTSRLVVVSIVPAALIVLLVTVIFRVPPYSYRKQRDNVLVQEINETIQYESSYAHNKRSVGIEGSDCFGSCSDINGNHYFDNDEEGLACLLAALRRDPERYGLRPHLGYAGLDDHLLDSSLRGRKIYFLGDSTIRYLFCWLKQLLGKANASEKNLVGLSSLDLKDANALIHPAGNKIPGCHDLVKPFYEFEDGTYIRWGPVHTQSQCSFKDLYLVLQGMRPDVIVANSGLHWLHFEGQGRNVDRCSIERWVNYEEWMEEVVKVAEDVEAKELLFKTTNHVCDEKYVGDFASATRLYREGGEITTNRCVTLISKQLANASDADILAYCTKGTFNSIGVCHLNERLRRFVQEREKNSTVNLRIFNDHDICNCSYTEMKDGRHYHALNLLRIRLLGNYLSV
eukprot:CAMPEP_0178476686 /NCGR_PEP_ID=MMETSP0696-20121128/3753_1 /TAXON_ID=265572 /ORGANISM="Extubocellulus spinifer, Strain CCMP396" /LENGTH=405 /DNA_ID=CAMNT_0020103993 /DNA_START=387 /DNA_END=1604 /DNA_ORIENTATION=+